MQSANEKIKISKQKHQTLWEKSNERCANLYREIEKLRENKESQ